MWLGFHISRSNNYSRDGRQLVSRGNKSAAWHLRQLLGTVLNGYKMNSTWAYDALSSWTFIFGDPCIASFVQTNNKNSRARRTTSIFFARAFIDWSHTGFVALTHNVNLVWTESTRVWPGWIHVYDNQYQPRLQVWTCLKIVSNKHHIECTRSNNTSQKCFKVPLSTTDLQALVYFYNFIYLYVDSAYLRWESLSWLYSNIAQIFSPQLMKTYKVEMLCPLCFLSFSSYCYNQINNYYTN